MKWVNNKFFRSVASVLRLPSGGEEVGNLNSDRILCDAVSSIEFLVVHAAGKGK